MCQALSSSVFKPLNPSRQRCELDNPISITPACAWGTNKGTKRLCPSPEAGSPAKVKEKGGGQREVSGKSPERRGGRALRHFLVIVTQHFEASAMAALVEGDTSAWAVLGWFPAPVWKYLT